VAEPLSRASTTVQALWPPTAVGAPWLFESIALSNFVSRLAR
jgi:hypothetical protein